MIFFGGSPPPVAHRLGRPPPPKPSLQTTCFVDPTPPGALQTIMFLDPMPPGSLHTTSFVDPPPPGAFHTTLLWIQHLLEVSRPPASSIQHLLETSRPILLSIRHHLEASRSRSGATCEPPRFHVCICCLFPPGWTFAPALPKQINAVRSQSLLGVLLLHQHKKSCPHGNPNETVP